MYYNSYLNGSLFGIVVISLLVFLIILRCLSKKKIIKILLSIFIVISFIEFTIFTFSTLAWLHLSKEKSIIYGKIAASLAFVPYERGTRYAQLGYYYDLLYSNKLQDDGNIDINDFNNQEYAIKSIEYYEIAHKYINYNDKVFKLAGLSYLHAKDYDKAIELFKIHNFYRDVAKCYIIKNDFENALEYALKAYEKFSSENNAVLLAYIYKKLGDNINSKFYYEKFNNSNCKGCNETYNSMLACGSQYFIDRDKCR